MYSYEYKIELWKHDTWHVARTPVYARISRLLAAWFYWKKKKKNSYSSYIRVLAYEYWLCSSTSGQYIQQQNDTWYILVYTRTRSQVLLLIMASLYEVERSVLQACGGITMYSHCCSCVTEIKKQRLHIIVPGAQSIPPLSDLWAEQDWHNVHVSRATDEYVRFNRGSIDTFSHIIPACAWDTCRTSWATALRVSRTTAAVSIVRTSAHIVSQSSYTTRCRYEYFQYFPVPT